MDVRINFFLRLRLDLKKEKLFLVSSPVRAQATELEEPADVPPEQLLGESYDASRPRSPPGGELWRRALQEEHPALLGVSSEVHRAAGEPEVRTLKTGLGLR